MFTADVNGPGLAFFIEAVGKAPRRGLTARRRPGLRCSNHSTSVMAFGAEGNERQGYSAAGSRRAPLARGRPGGAPEGSGAGSASPRRQPARERMRSRQPFSLALQNAARRPLSSPPRRLPPPSPVPGGREIGSDSSAPSAPAALRLGLAASASSSAPPGPNVPPLTPARRPLVPRPGALPAAAEGARPGAASCPARSHGRAPRSGRAAGRLRGRLRFPAPRAPRRAEGKKEGRRAKPPPPPALRIPAPGRSALRTAEAFFLRHQLLPGGGPALRLRLGLGWGLRAPPRPGSGRSRGRGCTRSRGLRPAGLGCARGQGGREAGGRKAAAAEGPGRAAERCALTAPYAGEGMRGGGREARRGGGARVSRGPGQDGGAGPGLARLRRLRRTAPAPEPRACQSHRPPLALRAGRGERGAARWRFHGRWARAVSIVTGGRTARDPDDDVTRPLARSRFPSSPLLPPGVSLGPGGAGAQSAGRRAVPWTLASIGRRAGTWRGGASAVRRPSYACTAGR